SSFYPSFYPTLLQECRFSVEIQEDTSDEPLDGTATNATPATSGQLGLSTFAAPDQCEPDRWEKE
ncbi:MAG: hypothetical protein WD002_00305, partial [Pseudomonadales bacterium]